MIVRFHCLAVIASLLSGSVAYAVDETEPLRVAGDRPADIVHIRLDVDVDVPAEAVKAKATIDLTALRELRSIRFDAVDFDVSAVTLARGEGPASPVEFINDGETVEVLLGDNPLPRGARGTVTIEYTIDHPKSGLHFFGPTDVDPNTPYVVWSQGESITNRYWVPCFDHPNEMQTTEMVVTVKSGHEVISNGRLVSKKNNGDGTSTFHWLQDKPHVSYLMSLIVGEFHVESETWRGKPVVYYVPKEHRDDIKRSFGNTTRMMDLFSDLTGVEYPWDKYAQTCAEGFGGGMENTSATTLGTTTLHDARAHLDFNSDGLVAHELAHQWFGDYVTCKDWSHLWLNEGFASFMSPVWFEHDLGKDEYDYGIYRSMKRAITGGKKRPVLDRHYEKPGDMFDSRSYPKGASILHMLRRRVGDELFWRSVKRYLTDNAHQPVETSDLRKAFERVTGRSLERFFHDWVERPGAPSLDVRYKWSEEDKLAEVTVKQTQEGEAFHFPLEIEFRFDDAEPVIVRRDVTVKEKRLLFPLSKHPTMVLIDPHEAVLREIKEKKGRDLWEAQLSAAPYAVSRIRAAEHLGESGGRPDVELLASALEKEPYWGVAAEIAEALGEAGGDEARDALLAGLGLPHPKVRKACADALKSFHRDEKVVSALYTLIQKGDPSYAVEAAAIGSYGKLQPDGAVSFLESLLTRDSHRERIRSAALRAMGEQPDASGLALLAAWTKPGKPRFCRMSAYSAMGKLAENMILNDEDATLVVQSLTANLADEHRWAKGAAIRALGKLGKRGKSALPALQAVASHDANERIRKAGEEAIKKIKKGQPAQVQVEDLRDELETLREDNEALQDRIEKLEATKG